MENGNFDSDRRKISKYFLRTGVSRLSPYVLAEREQLLLPKLDHPCQSSQKHVKKKACDKDYAHHADINEKAEDFQVICPEINIPNTQLETYKNDNSDNPLTHENKHLLDSTSLVAEDTDEEFSRRGNKYNHHSGKSINNNSLSVDHPNTKLYKEFLETGSNTPSSTEILSQFGQRCAKHKLTPLENLKQSYYIYENPYWPPRRSTRRDKTSCKVAHKYEKHRQLISSNESPSVTISKNICRKKCEHPLIRSTEGENSFIRHPSFENIKNESFEIHSINPVNKFAFPHDPQFLRNIASLCDGVITKKSNLGRGSGLGLFADRNFRKNQVITEYCGTIIDRETALQLRSLNASSHVISVGMPHSYINGFHIPIPFIGGGSFANDGRKMADRMTAGPGNNAQHIVWFDHRRGRDRVFLKAIKNIDCGAEILIGYDNFYWKSESSEKRKHKL